MSRLEWFYMVYGLSIWYILYIFLQYGPMVPTIFSSPAHVLAADHP